MADSGGAKPPLRRIHDRVYEESRRARDSLEYHRTLMTEEIIQSLPVDAKSPLIVTADGRVYQGNTRIKVLEERGYPVNDLPRMPYDD